MAWYSFITDGIGGLFRTKTQNVVSAQPQEVERERIVEMPIRGGTMVGTVIGSVSPTNLDGQVGVDGVFLNRPLADSDYDLLYNLGRTNHDVSFAKDNIVQLGKSPLHITFDSGVTAKAAQEMQTRITKRIEAWFGGGSTSMINALFRQIELFGCISAEAQPTARLDGIGRVVLLSPKFLYFGWDKKMGDWHPYQSGTVTSDTIAGYYQKLNTATYKYIPYETWREDIPYSVPPILSAIRGACIEDKMLDNVNAIVQRLGLLGFLEVVVQAPQRKKAGENNGQAETDQQYQARVQTYLQGLDQKVKAGVSNGYIISAKQMIDGKEVKPEFNMTASTSNPQGMVGLAEFIVSIKSAGLKQDPALLGKNFATTETLITTLLRKFTHQLMNFQELVCKFLEHAFTLDLRLAGYQFEYLDVTMDAPTLMDTQTEYSGLNQKRNYYKGLYDDGIINQTQYAQAMGYDKPDQEKPRAEI